MQVLKFFILILALISISFSPIKQDKPKIIEIGIIFTSNTNGILENCGCPGNPMGGLDKRLTIIKNLKSQTNNLSLVLDAGDVFSSIGFLEKDKFVLSAYKILPYDFIGIGDQEFSNGIDFFEEIKKELKDKLISANIEYQDGKPLAKKYVVKDIYGVKFGITSVAVEDPFAIMPQEKIKQIKVLDYTQALKNIIPILKEKSDIIILLSHLGYMRDVDIAKKFPEINIIIGAHSQTLLKEPETQDKCIIFHPGGNGEYVGYLKLKIDSENKNIIDYSSSLVPLLKDIKGDPKIRSILNAYQKFVSFGFKDTCLYSTPIPSEYIVVNNSTCMKCHEEIGYKWMLTKHANAFKTIIEDGRTNDPECLSCHTTGYCRPDGFTRKPYKKDLLNVGCVECHFVKPEHLNENYENTVEQVNPNVCIRCHNEERDPYFDFEKYVLKINHKESQLIDYIVKPGDYLYRISKHIYGTPEKWKLIYSLNKKMIKNPNFIFPGQKLKIAVINPNP
jgi:LysM repeat protein